MNEAMRAQAVNLRSMASADAANWLLEQYPRSNEGIVLLEHLSLRRSDTERLARAYLAGPTWTNGRPYRLFAQRLGLNGLVRLLDERKDRDGRDNELLRYHLEPIVRDCPSIEDQREAADFVASLK